jgi:exodeoxyribonuclease V alpha subunit
MLQRNLLYTAISRGKELVVLVGDPKAVALAVENAKEQFRYSRLAVRLLSLIK